MSDWNQAIIDEFRANGGKVGGMFEGAPLVLLTTTGRKSGRKHTNPATYLRDGRRILIFGSNNGGPRHPDWYFNLLANPYVSVEIGAGTDIETYRALAQPIKGDERDELYARQVDASPGFADYEKKTTRVIPVIALYPHDPAQGRALGDELVRIHDDLRHDLAALLAEVDGHPDLPTPSLTTQLRERCISVCNSLHAHHINESNRGFPLLDKRFPELAPILDQLRRDHEVLAELRSQLEKSLAELGTGINVQSELRRLASEIEAHFDREEKELVSALNSL